MIERLSERPKILLIEVSDEQRAIRKDWWDELTGPKPPPNFKNNGCTLSLDSVLGVLLWPACVIHDWHYSPLCIEVESRIEADYKFMSNTYRLMRLQGVDTLSASFYSLGRFVTVRRLGASHFKRRDEGENLQ